MASGPSGRAPTEVYELRQRTASAGSKNGQFPELEKIREQGRFVIKGERDKYDTI